MEISPSFLVPQIFGPQLLEIPTLPTLATSKWEIQSFCLQTHFIPQDHTGDNIKEALSATLLQWNLDQSKQVGITTDSGSNVKSACQLLNWSRLSCFGHNLNLAVEKGLNDGRV